ncbi:MAG: thioredoxin family protein [Methylocella sp.]
MLSRRALGFAVCAALLTAPPLFAGGPPAPFDEKAFAAAQAAGKPILIHVAAPWCPACKAQKPIIEKLALEPRFKDLEIFTIDFDTQKDLAARFGANLQSTLICFKGAKEVGRSIGETQPEWIEALLEKTL